MYGKIIKNDIKKSKLLTITITAFIMSAALLMALGVTLLVNLLGSINNLASDSIAPSFIIMQSGDIDQKKHDDFAAAYADIIDAMEVSEFLNIEGADIVNGDNTLSDSVQDNGVATQNEQMDFLLDLDNQVITPQDGEIYVPVYYKSEGFAKIGDTITIHGMSFTVAGYLRDSQMNASLASSKRFLISDNDYELLKEYGILEYLIEFRLVEGTSTSEFESAYLNYGLEINGQTAASSLVKLMNGLTDGIMIAMLILVALLVLIIAFLCVRFTLVSRVAEDYREIGVLKAIGLRVSEIKKLYLAKYGVLAAIGCILGYLLSIVLQKPLLANIALYMGPSEKEWFGTLLAICGAFFVYIIVVLYVNKVLNRFRKISAAQAIQSGTPQEKTKTSKGMTLAKNHLFSASTFLGIKDVFARQGLYMVMLFILVISCFIMVVPKNIAHTISDRSFMTYMGLGECDMKFYLQLVNDIPEKTADIANALAADDDVIKYSVLTCYMFDMQMPDGSTEKLKVELGDHTQFALSYTKGLEPRQDNEIAISTLNSEELGLGLNDTIVLTVDGQDREFTVCGIYSDVTNSGMTAKATFDTDSEDVMWCSIPIILSDTASTADKVAYYKELFSYAKVADSDVYMDQYLGSTSAAIQKISVAGILVSIMLTFLITLLFMKMLVTKDRYQLSVLKSLGFTSKSIKWQYMVRSGVILVLGVVLGTLMANTLGEVVGGAMMSSFSVRSFHFNIDSLFAYVISPLLIIICVYLATRFGLSGIDNIKVSDYIKE